MINIINEINLDNGSNYKMDILRKHKDNELLQRVLKMCYDKVSYTYGITMKNIIEPPLYDGELSLDIALNVLENQFVTREVTGNLAIDTLTNLFKHVSKDDAQIIKGIINRDLRINMGRSNINKVFKNLIVKPPYMRCGIYTEKTAKKINFPAFVQVKADGMAVFVTITKDEVYCSTRSGEQFYLNSLEELKNNPNLIDNVLQGEFLIQNETNRANGNGLLNSLIKYKQGTNNSLSLAEAEEIEKSILFQVWDLIPIGEYSRGKDKKNKTWYKERLSNLNNALHTTP